jgi:hypothetical protein
MLDETWGLNDDPQASDEKDSPKRVQRSLDSEFQNEIEGDFFKTRLKRLPVQ